MAEALTGDIGAASEELELQGFCVHRHQAHSRRFMFRPGIRTSALSAARKTRKPISLGCLGHDRSRSVGAVDHTVSVPALGM